MVKLGAFDVNQLTILPPLRGYLRSRFHFQDVEVFK